MGAPATETRDPCRDEGAAPAETGPPSGGSAGLEAVAAARIERDRSDRSGYAGWRRGRAMPENAMQPRPHRDPIVPGTGKGRLKGMFSADDFGPRVRQDRASVGRAECAMLFMVIERFKGRDAKAIYRRLREQGRGVPDGLRYIDGWVEASFDRCFQLMECDDARVLQQWVAFWGDLVEFEIVPVVPSSETRETIEPLL
jgi:hypothetical protein